MEKSDNTQNGNASQQIRGEIVRVIFEASDGSFTVFVLKDKNGEQHTAAASGISGFYPGQTVDLSGSFENHKDYGKRFKVDSAKFTMPCTVDGIRRFLSSKAIPGIGEKKADAIVKRFGLNTLDILENYSARLKEVPGLSTKKIAAIKKAWTEQAERRNTYIFLQGLGVSSAYCDRIYKKYGQQSTSIVSQNPYTLADEVSGIGFLMADRIAQANGIGKGDLMRLQSGALYVMNQLRNFGHTCFPLDKFREESASVLCVDMEESDKGVRAAIETKKMILEKSFPDMGDMIYDKSMFLLEKELPLILKKLMAVKFRRASAAIAKQKSPPGRSFSDEQLAAVERCGQSAISVITGGPGVGKTTVIGEIVRRACQGKVSVLLAAPTGRAAKRLAESGGLEAKTIHRLLKWDPVRKRFSRDADVPLECDLLIVDEVSMLDLPLAVNLFRAVSPGTTVVLVGDADQLPSVGPGNVLNDLISSSVLPVSRLTKIFRQGEGSRIIFNAHAVNSGHLPDMKHGDKNRLADYYWIEQDDPEKLASLICEMVSERIPARFNFDPVRDIQVLAPMNRGSCGTITLNEMLQAALNPGAGPQFKHGERKFKHGDKVMQISNNYDKNVYNGDIGTIHSIHSAGNGTFQVDYDGTIVEYEFAEAEQLVLSYAITVHKSQGCEFPVVVLPLLPQHYMLLQRNLLYTAMTRAKKLLILAGASKAVSMAVNNASKEPRFTLLLQRLKKAGI